MSRRVPYKPSWDISTIPTELIRSEAARRLPRAGRVPNPKVLRPCPYCGQQMGARELRAHQAICPKRHQDAA